MVRKEDPDWTSLEPELLARIYHNNRSGDFRLTCRRWRAAADASTDKLRITFVPGYSFQLGGRGAKSNVDLSSLDVRFGALKELEIESLNGIYLYNLQMHPLSSLQSVTSLTALRMNSTSAGGYTAETRDSAEVLTIDPGLLPAGIRELGLRCSLQRWPDHLTALAALRQLTQLRLCAMDLDTEALNDEFMDSFDLGDYLGNHLARLSCCTELRSIELGLYLQSREAQVLGSSVSQLTALRFLESLSLFENPLEPAGIGQALSVLTGLTCLRLMIDCLDLGGQAAEAALGPLRSLGSLQLLALSADDYYPPRLLNGRKDHGFLNTLASLPGALQLHIAFYTGVQYLGGPDEILKLNMRGFTRLTSLDLDLRCEEFSLDVHSLLGLRGLESLTWKDKEPLTVRDCEGLVQLGQLPLTALQLDINTVLPVVPHQLAEFAANCVDPGRLMCLSVKQAHALSDMDLQMLGLLTSLTSLKLDQLRITSWHHVESVRQFRTSAESTAIHHISLLTNLKRLHLEGFHPCAMRTWESCGQ